MSVLRSTMIEGKMVSWIKSEGDTLSKGDHVFVVESDKVDMDIETFYDGILVAIVVANDETTRVRALIGFLVDSPEEVAKAKAAKSAPSPTTASTRQLLLRHQQSLFLTLQQRLWPRLRRRSWPSNTRWTLRSVSRNWETRVLSKELGKSSVEGVGREDT
ncbi:hypothetical protein Fmac_000793 [Flemingia macrophylla]|uniref:Lipoyl-binding domain-containing protein n=1 Tax=Flemingia macrophylla TaxID=520843 RepID=A0ABD1NFX3_9FABA